jgi:4-hydroxy-tetrahydrodipicolinate synthase
MAGTESALATDLVDAFGCISALANIVPEQMLEVFALVKAGDLDAAGGLASHLQAVSELTRQHDSPGVLKTLASARSGIPMGTVRPPLLPPPASYDVHAALERLRLAPASR